MDHLDKAIIAAGIAGFCLGWLVNALLSRWAVRKYFKRLGE